MALPGYGITTSIATGATSVTYSAIDGNMSVSLSDSRDPLDTTDFTDSNLRRRILGLRDLSATLDGDLELADTAYAKLKAAYNAGEPTYLQFTADGTNGIVAVFVVESIERNGSVDGKVEVSISLQSEGSILPFEIGAGI